MTLWMLCGLNAKREEKESKEMVRNGLLSHRQVAEVSLALYCFTSRFGKGLGGSSTLKSRSKVLFSLFLLPPCVGITKRFASFEVMRSGNWEKAEYPFVCVKLMKLFDACSLLELTLCFPL
jgi:hypothetical protein